MDSLLKILKRNIGLIIYLFLLGILPFIFSSFLAVKFIEFVWFFKSLHPLDVGLIFIFFSLSMAFALTPTTFVCLASGYLWGWMSVIYIIPSYLLAQTLGFFLARWINGNRLYNSLLKMNKIPLFLNRIHENEAKFIILSRLSPILPFAIMNTVLSVLGVSFIKFTWAGLMGMLPRTLYFIWAGQRIKEVIANPEDSLGFKLAIIGVTFVTMGLMVSLIVKGTQRGKQAQIIN